MISAPSSVSSSGTLARCGTGRSWPCCCGPAAPATGLSTYPGRTSLGERVEQRRQLLVVPPRDTAFVVHDLQNALNRLGSLIHGILVGLSAPRGGACAGPPRTQFARRPCACRSAQAVPERPSGRAVSDRRPIRKRSVFVVLRADEPADLSAQSRVITVHRKLAVPHT